MPSAGLIPLKIRLEAAGHRTRLFRYPSYRRDIPANAQRLSQFLNNLGEQTIDVVTYSLGGILLRWAANHCGPIPQLRRVVMIGPPNQGSYLGSRLHNALGPVFPLMVGATAKQLRSGNEGLCAGAGLLPEETELGIIAGGTDNDRGYNFLIPGDNDRILKPEETQLEGMSDWVKIRAAHGPLVFSSLTARLARRFLATGSFASGASSARAGSFTRQASAQ